MGEFKKAQEDRDIARVFPFSIFFHEFLYLLNQKRENSKIAYLRNHKIYCPTFSPVCGIYFTIVFKEFLLFPFTHFKDISTLFLMGIKD